MNCVIRINEDPSGLKDFEGENTLAAFKRPLSSDCSGYGFTDENNISIHPGFGKYARECGN